MARHEDHAGSGADQGELSCPWDGAGTLSTKTAVIRSVATPAGGTSPA